MKFLLWTVFAVLALIWTGGAALLAQIVQWTAQGIAAPAAGAVGAAAATLSVPGWLAPWVDAAAWTAAVQAAGEALSAAQGWLPAIGQAVSWLAPAVWVAWGLGLLLMLALALAGHWGLARFGAPRGNRAQAA